MLPTSAEELERTAVQELERTAMRHVQYAVLEEATDGFAVGRKLGEGAFAEVFLGSLNLISPPVDNLDLPQSMAVKKDKDVGPRKDSWTKKAEEAELHVCSRYKHQNMCCLVGWSLDGLARCLVFEFCAGGSVSDRLRKNDTFPPLQSQHRLRLIAQLARALDYLHSATPAVIHRDVKCENVLIDEHGDAKLADFGTVRQQQQRTGLTHLSTQMVIGTRPYMPPEYIQKGHVSDKTDSYAAGVLMLVLLTNRSPAESDLADDANVAFEHGRFAELLDQSAGVWDPQRAAAVGRIAIACAESNARIRTRMSDVLCDLEVIAGLAQTPSRMHQPGAKRFYNPDSGSESGSAPNPPLSTAAVGLQRESASSLSTGMAPISRVSGSSTAASSDSQLVEGTAHGGGGGKGFDYQLFTDVQSMEIESRPRLTYRRRNVGVWLLLALAAALAVGLGVGLSDKHRRSSSASARSTSGSPTPAPTSHTFCVGSSASLRPEQCAAWQELYDVTGGNTTWTYCSEHRATPCECYGYVVVGCDFDAGDIFAIALQNNGLRGTLPTSLRSLTNLTYLQVGCNNLTGALPDLDYARLATPMAQCPDGRICGCALGGPLFHTAAHDGALVSSCPAGSPENQWSCPLAKGPGSSGLNNTFGGCYASCARQPTWAFK